MASNGWKIGGAAAVAGLIGFGIGTWTHTGLFKQVGPGIVSIDAGEWLQAFAAFAGVIATIGGTLFIESVLRKRERRSRFNLLRETLQLLRATCAAINAAQAEEPEDFDEFRKLMQTQMTNFVKGQASFDTAKAGLPIQSFNLWSSLNKIEVEYADNKAMLQRELNFVTGDTTLPILRIALANAHGFQNSIRFAIDGAISEIDDQF